MTTQATAESNTEQEAPKRTRAVYTAKDLINGGVGSRNLVYKMLKAGVIPSTQLGDKYLVSPEWVHANTTL
jgi:hypothetical protein